MTKPDILILGNQLPALISGASEIGNIHRLDVKDGVELSADVANIIRGVVTSSFVGFPTELFNKLPKLEIIGNFGVGVDSIDINEAQKHGVQVSNTPDVLTDDVADIALALMLSVSRRICEADRYVRSKQWPVKGMMPLTVKVSGKRVGIIGMGRIGVAIAKRAEAFGCQIGYQSRSPKPQLPYQYYASVEELAAASDFLIAACPLLPETFHVVGESVLAALGPQGVLVNIARGAVVDERALVAALVEGRIGGAGLDVFEEEPQVPEELLRLEQVVLLPHVGSATNETRGDMAQVVLQNLVAHFSGEPLLTPVTTP